MNTRNLNTIIAEARNSVQQRPVIATSESTTEHTVQSVYNDEELDALFSGTNIFESSSTEEVSSTDTNSLEESSNSNLEEEIEEEVLDESTESTYATNSSTLLDLETTARFKGADWYNIVQQQSIILAGVGGIGSWTSLLLSRMRPKALFIYDSDRVEMVNMSGQLFSKSDIGSFKTTSCSVNAENFSDYHDMFCINEFYTEESEASDIMICGFDNMKSRKVFFNSWVNHINSKTEVEKSTCLFIDGRMSAESIQVFAIVGNDKFTIDKYAKEWLFDDSEADETRCSYKQTTYCAAMIGAIITNLFVNFCTNLGTPNIPRYLPFMTSYEADTMYLKTELE